jgi:hypothetical protein
MRAPASRTAVPLLVLGVSAIGIAVALDSAFAETTPPSTAADDIFNLHHHRFFWWVMLGSVGGWVLGYSKGFTSAADWAKKYFEWLPGFLLFLVDAVVFAGLGAYLGTGIFDPNNIVAALAAGGTWAVGFGALLKTPEQQPKAGGDGHGN